MSDKQVVAVINIRTNATPHRAPHQLIVIEDASKPVDHLPSFDQSTCIKKPVNQCSECLTKSIESAASEFCMTCQQWMCDGHAIVHSRLVTQKQDGADHIVHTHKEYMNSSTIQQVVKQAATESTQFPSFSCQRHRLPIEQFCSDCDRYICVRCQLPTAADINDCPSDHTTQSLIDKWNKIEKECPHAQPSSQTLSENLKKLDAATRLLNKKESAALKIIHSVLNDSIGRSVQISFYDSLKNIQKKSGSLLSSMRAQFMNHKTKLNKLNQSIHQTVAIVHKQTANQSFNELSQSLRSLSQLLNQMERLADNTKLPCKPRLALKCNFDLIGGFDQSNIPKIQTNQSSDHVVGLSTSYIQSHNHTINLSTNNQTILQSISESTASELSIDDVVSVFDSALYTILRNWMHTQVAPVPVIQRLAERYTVITGQAVNAQIRDAMSDCFSTEVPTEPESEQDLLHVIEAPEITWLNVLSRIRMLPTDNGVFDQPTTQAIHSICDDLYLLSLDQSNYWLQLEDVDRTAILWFVVTHLKTKQSLIKALLKEGPNVIHSSVNRFISTDHALDYAYFYRLSHVLVNYSIYNIQDVTDEISSETRLRTVAIPDLYKSWNFKLNCVEELDDYNCQMLQDHRWLAVHVVGLSSPSPLVWSALKQAGMLRALVLNEPFHDNNCQQLAASLKFFPDIKTLDCRIGDISEATGLMLVRSMTQFSQSLVMLTLHNFTVDDRLMLTSMLRSLTSLSVLSFHAVTESVFVACAAAIPNAKSLESLSFSRSVVTRKCSQVLSSTLPQLNWLHRLSFTACSFDKSPETDELMHCIGKCALLRELTLRSCANSTWSTKCINVPLQRIDLSGSSKVNLADMQRLARTCPDLVCLDLRSTITSATCDGADLAAALAAWPHLKVLRLRAVVMSNQQQLCARLSSCRDLVELNLANLWLDANAAVVLSLQLQHLTQLRKFDISGNNISGKAGIVLARNLQHLTGLEHLNISENYIACVELRDALQKMRLLRHLNMSDIGLTAAQCEMFGSAFTETSQITDLDISSNNIGDGGIICLAGKGMHKLQIMRSFKASNTGLRSTSALGSRLGRLIQSWPELYVLDLSSNALRDDGIVEILQSMKMIFGRELMFDNCSFGDRGFKAILKFIPTMTVARCVSVCGNNISYAEYMLAITQKKFERVLEIDYM